MTAKSVLKKLEHHQVLIVGDVMLDRYLMGSVHRISPEAPVPVVLYQKTVDRLGGAANVALNVQALGARPLLCSVIGQDEHGTAFERLLPELGLRADGLVRSPQRQTTVKTRVLGNNQQMLRIDQEDSFDLLEQEAESLIERVGRLLDQEAIAGMILQDYNKGVLTPSTIGALLEAARRKGIPTSVDPKKNNFLDYRGVDLFKPNLKEIRDSAPFEVLPQLENLQKASSFLREQLENRLTMITLSEKGLFLDNGTTGGRLYPTVQRNVADVSGAGDTVISIATLGLIAGLDETILAALSNLAGGQVCESPGVVPVQLEILEAEFERWFNQYS
ncbi:MAG: carbohydrate kinase [Saprospiraceae bacterium]|nr:carbohydrate kinase [Saprospiraceae bacterium]